MNLKDETARELVKDVFKYVGEDMPETSIAERMRLRQLNRESEDYMLYDVEISLQPMDSLLTTIVLLT